MKYSLIEKAADWSTVELQTLLEKIIDTRGKSVPKAPNGIPLITAKNIKKGYIDYSSCEFIDQHLFETWLSRGNPRPNDVLFTTEAPLGNVALYPKFGTFAIGQRTVALRTNNRILLPKYLLYFILSDFCISIIDYYATGSTAKGIKSSVLKKIKVLLPPLPEQHRIVSVLETWDKAIELLTRKIEVKKKIKRALVHQLLSGKLILNGHTGERNLIKAGEIFKNSSEKNHPNEILLSASQEYGVVPRDQLSGRVTMPEGSRSSYKLVIPGDFVISLRSFQGGIEYSKFRGIVSPAYTILKPKVPISTRFFRYYFKSSEFIGRLNVAVIGIRDGKQISYDDFCTIKIPNLPVGKQEQVADILESSENEITTLQKQLSLLKDQKKYLLNNLITGAIRTPEDLLERISKVKS